MDKFFFELLYDTELNINSIDCAETNQLKAIECKIGLLHDALIKLKNFVYNYNFNSTQEEINFFKKFKPKLLSKVLFYNEIYSIEAQLPNSNEEILKQYYLSKLEQIDSYFNQNRCFFSYMRTDSTHLDELYFLRHNKSIISTFIHGKYFDSDPLFSTTHDFMAAKVIAHDLLIEYLVHAISKIGKDISLLPEKPLRWTGTKRGLVELIYAFDLCHVFNDGNTNLEEIARYFEKVFQIELGDFYHIYMELKGRKTPLKFIETIHSQLLHHMEASNL